ncbi:nucleotide-diphospho-sugar transferase [Cadophora sp. MPI-SDFR-AT-0126]|nr:nucleotide-diphospho-sugar transferase [Leotiomycetes sp. MPI-SDFR-AT-0126]
MGGTQTLAVFSSAELKWRNAFFLIDVLCKCIDDPEAYDFLHKLTDIVPSYLKALLESVIFLNGTWKPRLRILGDNVPAVDVIICCCKEEIDVILDTVRAALNTDYPNNRFRLIVSDDGAQRQVQDGVERLKKQYPQRNLYYTAQIKTTDNNHKSGNLNHAFGYVATLPGGPAPFFAGLDADMIVDRKWIRAQMPHLLLDPQMAFTCPPPTFYNIPVDDFLSQSLYVFQRFEEVIKDRTGLPGCTGSGWIMRRAALEDIGGFPSKSLTEDLLCGMMLLGKGMWHGLILAEELQWGMAPDSYHKHVQQRRRWSTGTLQAGLLMRLCLFGERARHLDPWQRLFGFIYLFMTFTASLAVVEMFSSMLLFATGSTNIIYTDIEQLKLLVRVAAINSLLGYVRLWQVALLSCYSATCKEMSGIMFMTPYFAYDHWKTFLLPKWLGGRPNPFSAKFVASGSIVDELSERSAKLRAPLYLRLKSVLFKDGAIFHVLVAMVFIIGLVLNVQRAYHLHPDDAKDFRLYLLTRILWVPPMWPFLIATFLKPVWYCLYPPSMPDREEFLTRDSTGLAYPTEDAKQTRYTGTGFGLEILDTLAVCYTFSVLVSTWWW